VCVCVCVCACVRVCVCVRVRVCVWHKNVVAHVDKDEHSTPPRDTMGARQTNKPMGSAHLSGWSGARKREDRAKDAAHFICATRRRTLGGGAQASHIIRPFLTSTPPSRHRSCKLQGQQHARSLPDLARPFEKALASHARMIGHHFANQAHPHDRPWLDGRVVAAAWGDHGCLHVPVNFQARKKRRTKKKKNACHHLHLRMKLFLLMPSPDILPLTTSPHAVDVRQTPGRLSWASPCRKTGQR
jgi:hypothetical protein